MQQSKVSGHVTGDAPRMHPGPWLLVVGMHRSGTSAVTGALGALGFSTPHSDDRWGWHKTNPDHWESISLNRFDESVLARYGGSWEAPPDLPAGWEESSVLDRVGEPAVTAGVAFRNPGPLVWKDPRICLLLPFWRRLLPPPVAAVLVWRSPLSVARSLRNRDGMSLGAGVALWERYNRSALQQLVGIDTYVCHYETVLGDPHGQFAEAADWLGGLPQFGALAGDWNPERAAATIADHPPRSTGTAGAEGQELLLDQHRELMSRLAGLEGGHRPLGPTRLMAESGWTGALLAARRGSRTRELDRLETQREALETRLEQTRLTLERLRGSTTWRLSQPLRSLSARVRR